jgi:uncharacterized membrane protein YkvA (DUF1232 family)
LNNIDLIADRLKQRVRESSFGKLVTPDASKKQGNLSIALLIVSFMYFIFPFDLIPDVPIVGWVDDFFFILIALINVAEKKVFYNYETIQKTLNKVKWVVAIAAVTFILMTLIVTFGALKIIFG